jgi:hypothetical protein
MDCCAEAMPAPRVTTQAVDMTIINLTIAFYPTVCSSLNQR